LLVHGNYSSCLFYASSEILLPERSLVEGEKLKQKETRKEKGKEKKYIDKNRKAFSGRSVYRPTSQNFDLCACNCKKVVKHNFCEKQERIFHSKGRLSDLGLF